MRKQTKPWVKETNNIVIRSNIQSIIGETDVPGMDNLVNYYRTLYNGERHYTRIVETKPEMTADERTKAKIQTSIHVYLEEHMDYIKKICEHRLREHYGEEYDRNFITVPDGYTVADVPKGFPTSKRRTTTAYPIPDEEMRARYFKHPLIPIMREGNVVKFMGLDSESRRPVLFAMAIDNDRTTNTQNILLVLEAHGEEEGIINLDRITCNPPTLHEDFERDGKGKIVVDKFGIAKTVKVFPVYTSNHNFCMQDRLTDPNGYSARVNEQDGGLVIKEGKAYRQETTADKKEELHPATFDDALSIFMNDHNIFHCQTPRYNMGSTFGALPDLESLLSLHFDPMILADEKTPFTLQSYKELGEFALEINKENMTCLQSEDQNIDPNNPANKRILRQLDDEQAPSLSLSQDMGEGLIR